MKAKEKREKDGCNAGRSGMVGGRRTKTREGDDKEGNWSGKEVENDRKEGRGQENEWI